MRRKKPSGGKRTEQLASVSGHPLAEGGEKTTKKEKKYRRRSLGTVFGGLNLFYLLRKNPDLVRFLTEELVDKKKKKNCKVMRGGMWQELLGKVHRRSSLALGNGSEGNEGPTPPLALLS